MRKLLRIRKRLAGTGILIIFVLLASDGKVSAQKESRPNIILFITDDISPNDIGCYGNEVIETPNIDKLAGMGMKFMNAYLTTSSCSPSRSSIITGRYPHNTGAAELYDTLPAGQVMFPLLLKRAGYYTVLSGKNDMGNQVKRAFDVFSKGNGPGGEADWVSILKKRPKDKPFFCWFAAHDAHRHGRHWNYGRQGKLYNPGQIKVPPMMFNGPVTRADLAGFYFEISRADYYMGQLLQELKREKVLNHTYIIFMSDNGRPFPRCKTYLYDSGIKTPFIVYGPGVKAHSTTGALISAIDVAPTVLAWARVKGDERMQGVDFSLLLDQTEDKVRDFVFAEHNWHVYAAHTRMVRYKNWVYIRNSLPNRRLLCGESARIFAAGRELWDAYDKHKTNPGQENIFWFPRPAEELYNVRNDPHQFQNLAKNKDDQKILAFLRNQLHQWVEETGDSKPSRLRADREDVYGHIWSRAWEKSVEEPGEANHATEITDPGPVLIQ